MKLAVVVIARNEGDRFKACIESLRASSGGFFTVYVDSGSTDASVEWAGQAGLEVLELDMSEPFTAARARNTGFKRALEMFPELEYVQFIDGDCQICADWFPAALNFMVEHPEVAVCCGRRRELYPERSIYNYLCDLEWNTPIGETKSCGGDALIRVSALKQAGGYRDDLIAGEEPELCVRLRKEGWKIWRLDLDMTLHDAAMSHFGQWWRRTKRAGYAFAQGASLHGASPERHWVKETRRALCWGLGGPLLAAIAGLFVGGWAALVLLIYPVQFIRLWIASRDRCSAPMQAFYLVLGKFAEALGVLRFCLDRLQRKRTALIEYK